MPDTQIGYIYEGGLHTSFHIQNAYVTDKGLLPLASATENGQCEFVRTKAAITKRVCNWVAERIGQLPHLPDPETHDSNEVLLETTIAPANIIPNADNKPIFMVSGQYIYGLREAVHKEGVKVSVSPPFSNGGQEPLTINNEAYKRYL